MTLWEFNACVRAYNQGQQKAGKEQISLCWHTAAFTGTALGRKLHKLNYYLKDTEKATAPAISTDEFERRLKQAEEGGRKNGT